MIVIRRKTYTTTVDAAVELGVSTKTVRQYIIKGIIPPPPEIKYGLRRMKHFPPEYIKLAKVLLKKFRENRILENG